MMKLSTYRKKWYVEHDGKTLVFDNSRSALEYIFAHSKKGSGGNVHER